jgi:Uma2 family endonuclease
LSGRRATSCGIDRPSRALQSEDACVSYQTRGDHLMSTKVEYTLEDLANVSGKAELVDGEIVLMSPTGGLPIYAAREIVASLREYERRSRTGYAITDNAAFVINLPHRTTISPDAAFYRGQLTMKFLEGAPAFAVEVRSENDYGARAETKMAEKRADYFSAGTEVVWDVDLRSDDVVRVYRAANPDHANIYHRGEVAEAEPAVPGWAMKVDELFMPE